MAEGGTDIETIASGSDATEITTEHDASLSAYCQPCQDEGERNDVEGFCEICKEHLCRVCIKIHRRTPALKRHRIVEATSKKVSGNLETKQIGINEVKRMPFEKCPIHEGQFYKFYCPHHDVFGCGDCTVVDHRTCKMQYIPDLAKEFKNSEEYNSQQIVLKELNAGISTCLEMIHEQFTTFDRQTGETMVAVKANISEILEGIEQHEGKLLEKIEQLKLEQQAPLNALKARCEFVQGEVCEVETELKSMEAEAIGLVMTSRRSKKRIEIIKGDIEKLETKCGQITSRKVIYQKGSLTVRGNILGTVDYDDHCVSQVQRRNIINGQFVLDRDINIERENDKYRNIVSSVISLSSTRLLLIDRYAETCKLLDTVNNKVVYTCQMESEPWDGTLLCGQRLAITLHKKKKFVVMSFADDKLTLENSVEMEDMCYGIAYSNNKLAVALHGGNNTASRIIIRQNKPKVISTDDKGSAFLKSPGFLQFGRHGEEEVLYISDVFSWNSFNLTKMTLDGNIVASYTDWDINTSAADGFTVTESGHVLLCNRRRHKIHLLSPDLEEIKVVLSENDGIRGPKAVHFCEKTSRLYVSSSNGHRNKIKVFKMCE